jgi:hypothetical protein
LKRKEPELLGNVKKMFTELYWKSRPCPNFKSFVLIIYFSTIILFCLNVNYFSIFAKPVLSPTLQRGSPKTGETFCPAGTGWPSWRRCSTILRPEEAAEVGQYRKGLGRTDDIQEELCPRRWALKMYSQNVYLGAGKNIWIAKQIKVDFWVTI